MNDMPRLIRAKQPLVLCLTNHVVTNFTANILLSVGASPIMTNAIEEISELVNIADALLINIGTLDSNFIPLALKALEEAQKKNIPIVFDPVGAGASSLRNEVSLKIIRFASQNQLLYNNYGKFLLKGNGGEIKSLLTVKNEEKDDSEFSLPSSKGVESAIDSGQALIAAKTLAALYNITICVTGETDYVVDNNPEGKTAALSNGSKYLSSLTGAGCALGALIAAAASKLSGKNVNYINNGANFSGSGIYCGASEMITSFNLAAEIACSSLKQPGSFLLGSLQSEIISVLHNLSMGVKMDMPPSRIKFLEK